MFAILFKHYRIIIICIDNKFSAEKVKTETSWTTSSEQVEDAILMYIAFRPQTTQFKKIINICFIFVQKIIN